jgi:hypothetical protein
MRTRGMVREVSGQGTEKRSEGERMTTDRKILALWCLEKLEDATKENWPWWSRHSATHLHGFDDDHETCHHKPHIPDFTNDNEAAVTLAVMMSQTMADKGHVGIALIPPSRFGEDWTVEFEDDPSIFWGGNGPTLGAALIAALEASE